MTIDAKRIGRIIGVLLLVQIAVGILVNFVLIGPATAAPGFLVNAAPHALAVGVTALIGLALAALSLGIAILAFPLFAQHGQAFAIWFLALAIAGFALAAAEQVALMSMLSLSEAYAQAAAGGREALETLTVVVRSARNWAHYSNLTVSGGMMLVLYGGLYRYALVPRLLAGIGILAVFSQLISVTGPFLGRDAILPMLMPLALTHLILALWLITKGFTDRDGARD